VARSNCSGSALQQKEREKIIHHVEIYTDRGGTHTHKVKKNKSTRKRGIFSSAKM
jgi:hypothetical protein